MQKIFYLPEAHTDFILAVIGEELGVVGICGLLSLYGMIGYAGLRTAKAARGAYAKLLATGLTSLILCQALLNIYTVLGLAPLTGVPLPFISSGSTSLIVLLCCDGAAAERRAGRLGPPASPSAAGAAMSGPRIVIAAGGTAGHVVPAIAVADALRAEGAEVTFVGGERAEAELVPAAGYPLDPIRVEGLSRSNPWPRARCAQGRRRGRRRRPDPAAGTGPTRCSAAAATSPARSGSRPSHARIPLVLAEADSHLGLTNRLLAPRARRVCLAFALARPRRAALPRDGPARPAARSPPRAARAGRWASAQDDRLLLVFGGSLGARSINQAAPRRVRGRALPRPPPGRPARHRRAAPRPARTTTCATTSCRSASPWRRPTSPSRAPAARSSSSRSTGSRPS